MTTRSALLIVDVMNRFDFPEAPQLLRQVRPVAPRIAALRRRFKRAGWPVIYANDNHGKWRSNFSQVVQACTAPDMPGAWLARLLVPDDDDYFVLKPQQSAFFATPLDALLRDLHIRRVVLAGVAGDGCVLATAIEGNMREFEMHVPRDCCASPSAARNRRALAVLDDAMRIPVAASTSIRIPRKVSAAK